MLLKGNKNMDHLARLHGTMLSDKNCYLGAFGNSLAQRKTRKQSRYFPQIMRFFKEFFFILLSTHAS